MALPPRHTARMIEVYVKSNPNASDALLIKLASSRNA